MKVIKYDILGKTAVYNPETGTVEQQDLIGSIITPWSETAEEKAKREAYNGEQTIGDDGQPDPESTSPVTWAALAAAYSEGVNEA